MNSEIRFFKIHLGLARDLLWRRCFAGGFPFSTVRKNGGGPPAPQDTRFQLEYSDAMPSAECPQCHLPTASVLGKVYCPQCGWNRGEADQQTRLFLRLLPVLVILFDAPLIVWVFVGHAEVPVLAVLGLIAIIPAILVVLVVKGKIRIGVFTRDPGKLP